MTPETPPALLLPSPQEIAERHPASDGARRSIQENRAAVRAVVNGTDPRLLVVVGPCSIHDFEAAIDYAERLAGEQARLAEDLLICMRVYLEKPRTSVGWKGFLHDPNLDGSNDVTFGLLRSRQLMLRVAEHGLGVATELLDPVLAVYQRDLLSWAAIGARTSESQVHRELASAQPFAVGFKNATDGSAEGAINSVLAAARSHTTFSIDAQGRAQLGCSSGNAHCHLVLRGGRRGPNYAAHHVEAAAQELATHQLQRRIMIDCSHGNSGKEHSAQSGVWNAICQQLEGGSPHLLGAMLESHLVAGRQPLGPKADLRYGQSITDACIDFATTAQLLEQLAQTHAGQRASRVGGMRRVEPLSL